MSRPSRSTTRSLICPWTWDLVPVIGCDFAGVSVCLIALTVLACLRGHHRVLLGLPAGRGLPAGPQDHRRGGQGPRTGHHRRRPARGRAAGHLGALVAIPIAAAFIVFLKPSQSASRLSQMKDHSNEARILTGL